MRHVNNLSRQPEKAAIEGHPGILESLSAFLVSPFTVLAHHLAKDRD